MFGLEPQDIIEVFTGSTSADFESDYNNGYEVIEEEIQNQWGKLKSALPKFVVKTLERVFEEILKPVDGIVTPSLPVAQMQYMRIFDSTVCQTGSGSLPFEDLGDGTFDTTTRLPVVATYLVDQEQFQDDSLKLILRDMVCCSLGHRIFPSGSEVWKIVEYHCEAAKEALKEIKADKNWLPVSMKGMNFNKTIFASIRVSRA